MAQENTKVLVAGGDGEGNVIVAVAYMRQSHRQLYIAHRETALPIMNIRTTGWEGMQVVACFYLCILAT